MLSFRKILNLRAFDLSQWTAIGLVVLFALPTEISRRRYPRLVEILPPASNSVFVEPVDCMVVVPALNGGRKMGKAVSSLPPDTVIVVDGLSQDGTAEEARKAGAGVLPAPKLPDGELGKAHACMAGARILTSRWI